MSDGHFLKSDGVDLKDLFSAQLEVLHTLIDANDKNYNQRFDNNTEATKAALAAADRATSKAEAAAEKRFEGVNEFRGQLSDQARTLMPRQEVEIVNKGISDRLDKLEEKVISGEGRGIGVGQGIAYIVGILGLTFGIISMFAK
jgi:hypothetical protein